MVTANYTAPDGTVKSYDFCAECGKVNDKAVMTEITDSFSAYGQLYVYTGTLDNGEKMMTVTCLSGQGAMDEIDPRVRIANEAVQSRALLSHGRCTPTCTRTGRMCPAFSWRTPGS